MYYYRFNGNAVELRHLCEELRKGYARDGYLFLYDYYTSNALIETKWKRMSTIEVIIDILNKKKKVFEYNPTQGPTWVLKPQEEEE